MSSTIIQRNQQMTSDHSDRTESLVGDGDAAIGNANVSTVKKLQMWSHLASHIFAFLALVFVGWWISLLGGLAKTSGMPIM